MLFAVPFTPFNPITPVNFGTQVHQIKQQFSEVLLDSNEIIL